MSHNYCTLTFRIHTDWGLCWRAWFTEWWIPECLGRVGGFGEGEGGGGGVGDHGRPAAALWGDTGNGECCAGDHQENEGDLWLWPNGVSFHRGQYWAMLFFFTNCLFSYKEYNVCLSWIQLFECYKVGKRWSLISPWLVAQQQWLWWWHEALEEIVYVLFR